MTTKNNPSWLQDFKQLCLPTFDQFPDLDLYMDQVIQETNKYLTPILGKQVTKTMINSYVKMELVARPIKKKYSAEHIATIMMVSILKTAFTLDTIKQLLTSDDLQAYFNQFVLKFNHEIEHLEEPTTSFSEMELAIRAVLYKRMLEMSILN